MAENDGIQATPAKSLNHRLNFTLKISKLDFDILTAIVRKRYCATKVAEELNLSKTDVHYHIRKLQNLGLIKIINPGDRIKFYEPTVRYKVTPVDHGRALLLRSNYPGQGSRFGILQPDTRKTKLTLVNGHKRELTARVHHAAYKVPVLEKSKDQYKTIPWDQVKTPHGKFMQHKKTLNIPDVGKTTFIWNHSKHKDTLITYLPELNLFPHELDDLETMKVNYLWKALKHFTKRYHVGFERLPEQVGKQHIAWPPSKEAEEYIKKHGTVTAKTKNGEAYVDDSEKTGKGEVEFTDAGEAKIYGELQEGLLQPGVFMEMEGQVSQLNSHVTTLDNQVVTLSHAVTETQQHHQETEHFLQAFTQNFEKFLQADDKKWEAQKEFNQIMKEYVERTDKRLEWIMQKTGVGAMPTKQTKLDAFSQKEDKKPDDGDQMYG